MDFYLKRAQELEKNYTDQLTKYYDTLKPLREQQVALMTPGAKEQELATQANNLKTQIQQRATRKKARNERRKW